MIRCLDSHVRSMVAPSNGHVCMLSVGLHDSARWARFQSGLRNLQKATKQTGLPSSCSIPLNKSWRLILRKDISMRNTFPKSYEHHGRLLHNIHLVWELVHVAPIKMTRVEELDTRPHRTTLLILGSRPSSTIIRLDRGGPYAVLPPCGSPHFFFSRSAMQCQ